MLGNIVIFFDIANGKRNLSVSFLLNNWYSCS